MSSIYDNDGSPTYYARKFQSLQKNKDRSFHWTRSIVREWGDGTEVHDSFLNELISDLAWKDREELYPLDYYDENYDDSLAENEGKFYYRVCIEALAQRLRFDYKYDELFELTNKVDPLVSNLIVPFKAFGALASGRSDCLDHLKEALWDENRTEAAKYILLQGLYLGSSLGEKQGKYIIDLSDDMIKHGEDNATLYFWRAFGLKRLYRYKEALETIDYAIRMLESHEINIHRDFSMERNSIVTCMIMEDHFNKIVKESNKSNE